MAVEELKHQSEEIISQSVAERVSLLEKQVADAQWRKNMLESTTIRKDFASDSPSDLCTRSAPLSSLSFSYDSGGIITKEPEGNRVRYIKEMFLAKSAADIQHGQRGFPSSNTSETLDGRPETSNSGGYQSQTSSELSSGEDDSTRKGISKGFVRRTIERLYGKKDATAAEAASQRPTSAPKPEKKESSSIFSPFHQAQSKLMSDLSYFSSTNTLDTLSEATRCLAFNAQVVPRDTVPIDKGRWLLRDDPQITKSVSDPVGINKTSENSQQDEDENTKEDVPYSLFSTKSDSEDKGKLVSTKCTYFSLPHASESDFSQDDQSTVRKGSVNGDSAVEMKDLAENKKRPEKNSMRPAVIATDFKMPDNKIHPLVPAGEAVVVQPKKGHGVVHRRPQEPDVLDVMYTFCGQHCPIL
ncbi:oxygen-regulated protein 1-like [Diretmus argenteus]